MCVDFRALKFIIENDPYQMPRIDDILDSLAEATLYKQNRPE